MMSGFYNLSYLSHQPYEALLRSYLDINYIMQLQCFYQIKLHCIPVLHLPHHQVLSVFSNYKFKIDSSNSARLGFTINSPFLLPQHEMVRLIGISETANAADAINKPLHQQYISSLEISDTNTAL
jgi:hypothetical protein